VTEAVDQDRFLAETEGSMELVYNIARRMVPRREDAEDLVQETYLAAYRAWTEHRRPRKVEPWIATICLNLGRSGFRHRARRPTEVPWDEHLDLGVEAGTEEQALAGLERVALHRALWSLPEEQRIALALVDLGGLSTREASEVMGTPRGTVLSRLHRARRALATVLEPQIMERRG
jgi:RNA polymerase sigma-70 factor, ECF subfamily